MAQNDTLEPLVLASLSSIRMQDDDIVALAATAAGPAPNNSADTAVAGAAARSTFAVNGAGVTIGIISDSFNSNGQAAANQAAAYLPNVTVLDDESGTDEGQAIAELVHETAPGAAIVFDAVGTTLSAFASAVTALQNAGSKIIIDDVGVLNEPFFELGDVLETAIEKFIAAGGSYFTSAGNDGGTYYQAAFDGISAALPGSTALVTAENFGGGSILESFTHTSTAVLSVSEDAYAGNAQFDVMVDGTQYGGVYTVTASDAAGQTQNVTISGIPEQFASHDIAVTFLNDLYDGNPSADRNLYVNAIQFDGDAVPGGSATLLSDGAQHFTVSAPNNYVG